MFLFLLIRSRDEADAKLWEDHIQEDQYRPSDEFPCHLCEFSNYSPFFLISGWPTSFCFDHIGAHF